MPLHSWIQIFTTARNTLASSTYPVAQSIIALLESHELAAAFVIARPMCAPAFLHFTQP
jgi:hypothetical protein